VANDLLITAIRDAGLDLDQVADIADADPRTVQRWLAGRVPHPRYRHKLAVHLDREEHELWPETGRARGQTALGEITAAYPRRNDPNAPDWRALLRSAHQQIDMLGYSLQHLAQARQITKLLADKARDGCQIRIALADPAGQPALAADQQQRPSGRLTSRIQDTQRRLAPLLGQPRIELRQHQIATTHTILRFDDHMLLTIHLYGTPGFQAPLLHLRRQHDYGLFDQLAKHIEDVWEASQPLDGQDPRPELPTPTALKTAAERDQFLDSLDTVWRPTR
jgi:transposase